MIMLNDHSPSRERSSANLHIHVPSKGIKAGVAYGMDLKNGLNGEAMTLMKFHNFCMVSNHDSKCNCK